MVNPAARLCGSRRRSTAHVGGATNRLGLALLAIGLGVYFEVRAGNFLTYNNVTSILVNTSSILIAAIAAARLLIAGAVDLSLGGIYALTGVVCAMVGVTSGSALLAVVCALGLGVVVGAINGALVKWLRISPIIVTLGLAAIYRGVTLVMTDAVSVSGLPAPLLELGRGRWLGIPIPVIAATGVFAIGSWLLTRTVAGLRSYAIGGNPEAARLAGVNTDRHRFWLFVYLGASLAMVGILSTARLGSGTPTIGIGFEIDVLTAVVLGGVSFSGGAGRPFGVFVGVVTIGILNAGMIFAGLSGFHQQIAKGFVLLAALAADQVLAQRRKPSGARSLPGRRTAPVSIDSGEATSPRRRPSEAVVRVEGLTKMYGSVLAVDQVSFEARRHQVLCLVGDNGAGKSTVIRMLSGVDQPDDGRIIVEGHRTVFDGPAHARSLGIETVHQNLALCPNLSAAYNLVLGREPTRFGAGPIRVLDRQASVDEVRDRLRILGVELDDYMRSVSALSGGQRQAISIARALRDDASLVVLDEPTAALGVGQTDNVLRVIRQTANHGAAVVMVTHDVESVMRLADRIVVLSLGRVVHDGPASELETGDLIHLMAGLAV